MQNCIRAGVKPLKHPLKIPSFVILLNTAPKVLGVSFANLVIGNAMYAEINLSIACKPTSLAQLSTKNPDKDGLRIAYKVCLYGVRRSYS